MTDQLERTIKEHRATLEQWIDNMEPTSVCLEVFDAALADARRRAFEEVAARIIDTHRMGDRDAWLALARLIRAKANAGKEAPHD